MAKRGVPDGQPDRLTVTLARGQRAVLEALAERNGVPLSLVVRLALARFIEEHEAGQLRLSFTATQEGER